MNTSADLLKQLRIDRQRPAAPPPARRTGWIIAAIVLVLLLAAAAWWFTRTPVLKVQTAPVVAISAGSSSASVLDASGYVVARRMATVSAQVTGKVRQVMIEEGMRVEEGQVMATLDPLDADAQRTLSASQLSAARSQVDNMQAQLTVANADATRLQSLVGAQLVSRSQYEQAAAQRDALRAQLQNAQRNVKVAADQLAIAGIRSDFNVVRAPFAGVVTAKAAQPGEIVSPLSAGGGFTRTGIGTIVDMDSLEIEVEVGESYIGRVQPKMPVEAVLNAYPDWKIPGEVIAIIPTADRGKATVKVRVAFKVKDARIVPEMGVRVSFLEQAKPQQAAKPQGVRVPAAALVERGGSTMAFVVGEQNRVAARTVTPGMAMGDDRQVLSGLAAGDSVVLSPPQALKDGDTVSDAQPDATE
ncbi:efflux RND transporter periplasmic adaptor subunit [Xanthomonas melonis]|uniref:Efflux RND transporter periplasmic adaptor subunit n=1 Tax=Xanthomonas melonis TaxID=56456 RepID=A0ABS8NRM5_9XANT|nr:MULTISPECIES: efflux RND transporter periplasmic adaptor subunit [Xanthomonas]MCC4587663.1 efflux RND transporter periplasmic adaptor subunit [Xanthomonas sp. NCPPB 1067]MCD0257499.1 efflux RND transporter periplasmic adaptor subunit [Xanthomonas melonis]MCD0265719.1 efflux RND transporter periplasmic adaptor subunit [Xanthomonas melonis]MCD0278491.1 efflux RND transporter periplasmic adaptor subunit [Xanthomonas melonis]